MTSYIALAWHCGREVAVRLTYSVTEERGYQVARLVSIQELESHLLKAA
ncbi:MAG TPA: hypothetical protein VEU11_17170 [Terriglobales bacterium]|nr:hypothetical protein [Terriglobales bacterium]